MLKDAIAKMAASEDLNPGEAEAAMMEIMEGIATPAQVGAFLVASRMKGETMGEILGFARAIRAKAIPVGWGAGAVDVCGTGGDGAQTLNLSTASAFVVAGAGVPVVKHGNRSFSSRCGSADVLEELGIDITMEPETAGRCLEETGMTFLFAPVYHRAMRYVSGPRTELGLRTVFNLLGPLCNPSGVKAQVVGVYAQDLTGRVAEALAALGTTHAMVVHSLDGLDEISAAAPTQVSEIKDGRMKTYLIDPRELGLQASRDSVAGKDAKANAEALMSVLRGDPLPARDWVLLNAAAGLVVGGAAGDLREGIALGERAIVTGAALDTLLAMRRFSQEVVR
jgi:anthranilate phosphoribosyltransferase